MAKTSISIRLDPELGDQLSTVAARLDRPKS
jgi:predicted transcriptional regulator